MFWCQKHGRWGVRKCGECLRAAQRQEKPVEPPADPEKQNVKLRTKNAALKAENTYLKSQVEPLRAQLAEALKYGAPVGDAVVLSSVKDPCKQHNPYWTTHSGGCMACRAEKAEEELAVTRLTLRRLEMALYAEQHAKLKAQLEELDASSKAH